MARVPSIVVHGPSAAIASLPWRWFEFRRTPGAVGLPLSVDPDAVFAVELDTHRVPFKFFRQPAGGAGERPTAMLLHGMGLTIASFRGIAPYLLATHDLICPDYSGFSQDNMPLPDHTSFKSFALSVWRIADALGIGRLSLIGNSLGGGLSLMAALLAPERVERIILSNPACFPQQLPTMYRLFRIPLLGELLMMATAPGRFVDGSEYVGYVDRTRFDPALRGIYTASLIPCRNRLRLLQLIRQLPADARDVSGAAHLGHLPALRTPILLSWGQKDPLLTDGAGERLAAVLPNVTFERYPNLSHIPHEEAPEILGPRWAQFLNGA